MKFDQNIPIYLQIMDDFKRMIISSKYISGERVDTVRELAITYGVNPNTVQRALSELEHEGLVRSERTSGRFITDNQELINTIRQGFAKDTICKFIKEMQLLGFSEEQIIESVKGSLTNGE